MSGSGGAAHEASGGEHAVDVQRRHDQRHRDGGMRAWVQNLALLAASTLVVVLLAEGLLRLFPQLLTQEAALRLHWRAVANSEVATQGTMIVPDDRVGYLYRPLAQGHIARGDLAFSFETDEHGFRNPSPWPDRADIIVIGDSMAFGYGVTREEAWPSLIPGEVAGASVVNLGLIGAAPQQEARIFERFGLGLEPNLLVFTLFPGNDLYDARVFASWEAAGRPVPFHAWKLAGGLPQEAGIVAALRDGSYVAALLRDAVKSLSSPVKNLSLTLADGGRLDLVPSAYLGSVTRARPDHPDFQLVMDTILETERLARGHGTAMLVVTIPTKESVYMPMAGGRPPDLTTPFVAALGARGVNVLDVTEELRQAAEDGERLYFTVDGHPNAVGNRIIASSVSRWLRLHPEIMDPTSGS
jgi:hypothetical protein